MTIDQCRLRISTHLKRRYEAGGGDMGERGRYVTVSRWRSSDEKNYPRDAGWM